MATVNYSWTLPTVGASVNTWGTLLNTIIDDIDAKMVSKTGAQTLTNKTLTAPVINGFTGDTSAINIGSGQLVKDTSGNLGLGATPQSGGGAARWVTAGSDAGSTYSGGFISAVGSTAKGYVYYDNVGSVNTFVMQAAVGVSLGFRANAANVNQMTLDTSGNLQVMGYGNLSVGGNMLTIAQDKALPVAPSGSYFFNLEALSGLVTAGLLIIRGNENGINQTVAVYTYNLAYYDGSSTRHARLTQISRNTLNNGYGDVYPYFSNYSGSYTSTDQSISGTSTSTSDVYFRNAVGGNCNANFSIIRIN